MSTDRELLELAAKAAGLNVVWYGAHFGEGFRIKGEQVGYRHGQPWNPLNDDGDALRLAVKLNLQVTPGTYNKDEASAFHAGAGEAHEHVHYQQDLLAATRRAIVLAAAQIGKTNQPGEAG